MTAKIYFPLSSTPPASPQVLLATTPKLNLVSRGTQCSSCASASHHSTKAAQPWCQAAGASPRLKQPWWSSEKLRGGCTEWGSAAPETLLIASTQSSCSIINSLIVYASHSGVRNASSRLGPSPAPGRAHSVSMPHCSVCSPTYESIWVACKCSPSRMLAPYKGIKLQDPDRAAVRGCCMHWGCLQRLALRRDVTGAADAVRLPNLVQRLPLRMHVGHACLTSVLLEDDVVDEVVVQRRAPPAV